MGFTAEDRKIIHWAPQTSLEREFSVWLMEKIFGRKQKKGKLSYRLLQCRIKKI